MVVAIWMIAICEMIRLFQNTLQLYMTRKNHRDCIDALNINDKAFTDIFKEVEQIADEDR